MRCKIVEMLRKESGKFYVWCSGEREVLCLVFGFMFGVLSYCGESGHYSIELLLGERGF